jgi:hypothetical protein
MTAPRTLLIARPRSDWSIQLSGDLASTHRLPPNWTATTIPAALSQLGFEAPDLIVVIQETPDQFSNHDVQQLLGIWPLARLVVCYGPWCNGDGRTRDAWPQATRVAHTSIDTRLASERSFSVGLGDGLPWTAGRDEIAAAEMDALNTTPTPPFTFHVVSPDPDWSRTLTDQLVAVGGHPSPTIDADTDLLLVDADPWDPGRLDSLIQSTTPPAILLLTHTPHSIPRSDLDDTLQAHPEIVRLEVHDKLVAATRPAALPTT